MTIEMARSLLGHDKNQIYLIWKREEDFAWLVNGRTHPIEKPKKKNTKHYQIIKRIPPDILVRIQEADALTDELIRWLLKEYERQSIK